MHMQTAKASPAGQATMAGRQQPVFVRTAPGPNAAITSRWPPGQAQGSPAAAQVAKAGTAPAAAAGPLQRQQAATALQHVNASTGQQGRIGQPPVDDFLDPDQDPNALRSPGGSLVSSVTTLPCPLGAGEGSTGWNLSGGQNSARGHGGASANAGVSIPEVLATVENLASRVNECLEQMPTRIDEATSEFRADMTSVRAEMRALSEASASCLVRTEVLEKSLKEESSNLAAAIKTSSQALKQDLSDQIVEGLAGQRAHGQELAEELRNLGRDLREQFQQELERLRDSVMREMRERMDGQKVLREEVQLQHNSLLRLTSRVEESLVELRTELPRLSQDQISQQQEIQRIQEAIGGAQGGGLQAKTDQLERSHREQRDHNLAVEADLRQELREMHLEATSHDQQISSLKERVATEYKLLQEAVDEQRNELKLGFDEQSQSLEKRSRELTQALDERSEQLRSESSQSSSHLNEEIRRAEQSVRELVQAAETQSTEALAGLQKKLENVCDDQWRSELEARESLQLRVQSEAQEAKEQLQSQVTGLERALVELDDGLRGWADKRVGESESMIHHWVEATLSGRINAMDKSLKKEMTERASTHDQVLDMITHNSERWCQLQAKFDELLVQVQKNNLSSFVSIGSIGSHGASTPVGSNFGGGSVVDISNGGPLAGRSSEDR